MPECCHTAPRNRLTKKVPLVVARRRESLLVTIVRHTSITIRQPSREQATRGGEWWVIIPSAGVQRETLELTTKTIGEVDGLGYNNESRENISELN
jgi:hypothetical protein